MNDLRLRSAAERARLPKRSEHLRDFWKSYLVGRGGLLGIELLGATSAYREMMRSQILALQLSSHQSVVDLGSGVGSLLAGVAGTTGSLDNVRILEVDYVGQALLGARARYVENLAKRGVAVGFVAADLSGSRAAGGIPLADMSQDSALASLLLSYVSDPAALLAEVARILKPGGRLVVSTLKPDADTSRIFMSGAHEIRTGATEVSSSAQDSQRLEQSLRAFLNDAARLIDLEEKGVFTFWDKAEIMALLRRAGFGDVQVRSCFGSPPQAFIATATRS